MTAAVSVASKAATVAKGGAKNATSTATKGAGKAAGAAGKRTSSTAAQQRAGIQAIKDARPPESPRPPGFPPADAPTSTEPAQSATSRQLPSLPGPVSDAAGTGSGFLLGVFAWAVGLAYLQGGSSGVKKFLNAKFLNKL